MFLKVVSSEKKLIALLTFVPLLRKQTGGELESPREIKAALRDRKEASKTDSCKKILQSNK